MSDTFESTVPSSTQPPARRVSPGLAKLLSRMNIVTPEGIESLLPHSRHCKILAHLTELNQLDQMDLLRRIAGELALSIVDLSQPGLIEGARALPVPAKFDRRFAMEHRCFPYAESEEALHVAMADPLDLEAINQIEFLFQTRVIVAVAPEAGVIYAINQLFGEADNVQVLAKRRVASIAGQDDLEKASKAAPVVRFVNKVLADAIRQQASDIHLEPSGDKLEIRFRRDGIMRTHAAVPERLRPYIVTRIKILAEMNIAERRRPQDGSFSISTGTGATCDVRVSSVPTPAGEKLVLRVLNTGLDEARFGALGMHPDVFERFKETIAQPDRIVCVTGPTGSGKSTTLYAALRYLRDGTKNIITVEDPIEYRLEGITQIQVDNKIDVTFASGLRSILRQDPDIIFVGEIRDLETAEVAFQAAQTGHLVLTTLHTNSAAAAVVRLQDLGLEPYVIAASLGGVLAQRLVRKLCDRCARPLSPSESDAFRRYTGLDSNRARRAVGCAKCSDSGYSGRIGVYSFLQITREIREAIREGASEDFVDQIARKHGYSDLWQTGVALAADGTTSLEEISRVVGREDKGDRSAPVKPKKVVPVPQASISSAGKTVEESAASEGGHVSILEMAETMREADEKAESRRVLLIDDDPHVRKIMHRELKKENFEVIEAIDGNDGIAKAIEHNPDLIVCDLMMPGCDGKQVVQTLRQNDATREIPMVMLTSMSDEVYELELIKSGADDFITKSSSPKVVAARIKRFLRM